MKVVTGKIIETQRAADGQRRLVIQAPPEVLPTPGQYLTATKLNGSIEPFNTTLFASKLASDHFIAAPPFPAHWQPGDSLNLFGPLGKGFQLTRQATRLALVGLDEHIARLESFLYEPTLEIAIFSDAALPTLPISVEANPLSALEHAFKWADQFYFDLRLTQLEALNTLLENLPRPTEAQLLIHTPMPCAGLAECGVCAVPLHAKPKWAYACEKGPVFQFKDVRLNA